MSEPVTLYGPDGQAVTVYGPAEAAGWAAKGYGLMPPEPGPAVTETIMDDPAPKLSPVERTTVKRKSDKE